MLPVTVKSARKNGRPSNNGNLPEGEKTETNTYKKYF
jgi:hypothetical protein